MNIKTDSAFLDPDAQYLGTRPEDHVVLFEQDALCIIEIHFDMGELGSQTFQEVQHSSRYLPLRMDEPEFYALLGLAEPKYVCKKNAHVKRMDRVCSAWNHL